MLTYKKKMTTHAAHARFLAECSETVGEIKRDVMKSAGIRTPYSSGPTTCVREWNGMLVIVAETAHRTFEIWTVDPSVVQPEGTDDAEYDAQIRASAQEG